MTGAVSRTVNRYWPGATWRAGKAIAVFVPTRARALTASETTSSIVLYFSLFCAIGGLLTWPFGWVTPTWPELTALVTIGIFGGLAHIFLTESYRHAPASLVAPFDYTSMLWALLLGFARLHRRRHHRRCRPVRDLARTAARLAAHPRRRRTADRDLISG